jgi:hypothetical protein
LIEALPQRWNSLGIALSLVWNNGKPLAYRKGAAEPYPKDFLCKA